MKIAVFLLFLVVGCSAKAPLVLGSSTSDKSSDLADKSSSYHGFILGELLLAEQKREPAFKQLSIAASKVSEPAPILHQRLAFFKLRDSQLEAALSEAELAKNQDPENVGHLLLFAGISSVLGSKDLSKQQIAIDAYRRASQIDPNRSEIVALLAVELIRSGRVDQSNQLLSAFLKKISSQPLPHLLLARGLDLQKNYQSAEASYLKALELSKNYRVSSLDLLKIYLVTGKNKEASQLLATETKINPEDLVLRKISESLDQGGDTAIELIETEISERNQPQEIRSLIALDFVVSQSASDSVRELMLLLAANPKDFAARYLLASVLAGQGKRLEALEELSEIPKASNFFLKSRTLAAFIFRQEEDLVGAEKAVREALEVYPSHISLQYFLASVLRDGKKIVQAEEVLERVLALNSSDEKILFLTALTKSDLKKSAEAQYYMEKVVLLNSENPDALNFVAYSLAENGSQLSRARELVSKAMNLKPADPYFLDTLGWIDFKLGDLKSAEVTLRRAVLLSSDDPLILEHLAEVLVAKGEKKEAIRLYQQALTGTESKKDFKRENLELQSCLERIRKALEQLK